jgi:hypothetical protein
VVGPVEQNDNGANSSGSTVGAGGVGLGFTHEDLVTWITSSASSTTTTWSSDRGR